MRVAFADQVARIRGEILEPIDPAGGPVDLDAVDLLRRSEAEMKPRVGRGLEAPAPEPKLASQAPAAGLDRSRGPRRRRDSSRTPSSRSVDAPVIAPAWLWK